LFTSRPLTRDEIPLIFSIDRAELIENIYYFENGGLVLRPERYDMQGWPPGEPELNIPHLFDCFDRGGWFYGLFDGDQLAAVAVLESRLISPQGDQLQLKFLHVGRSYRRQGLGTQLFDLAKGEARRRGARRLYISATPSENTVDFYLRRGCMLVRQPDPELFALEPEDIHLECEV
jgi:predicted N-acetyltransferase YhbS